MIPDITIGVPVYQGEAFLAETLQSIVLQTHRDFKVLISLDGPHSAAEALCRPFLDDSRFQLYVQPARLGWVGNVNWLMARVDTPFWCLQPQDDLIVPYYLATLLAEARRWPRAAVVYSDLVGFGLQTWQAIQDSVTGEAFIRQLALLHDHHPAVAFRGLTRVEALHQLPGIPTNEADNFSCDTTWMSVMAGWGDLRRVPGNLYLNRYHEQNTHTKWLTWAPEQLEWAWMVHCADMLQQAMRIEAPTTERRMLWLAALGRFVAPRHNFGYMPASSLRPQQRDRLILAFCNYLEQKRQLAIADWLQVESAALVSWSANFFSPLRPLHHVRATTLAGKRRQASQPFDLFPAGRKSLRRLGGTRQ